MEEKRSIGVTVFGLLIIVLGVLGILFNLKTYPASAGTALKNFVVICNTLLVFSLIYGVGILLLKEWARKLAILINIIVLVIYPLLLAIWKIPAPLYDLVISLGFSIAILYFFTRPGVKGQFK